MTVIRCEICGENMDKDDAVLKRTRVPMRYDGELLGTKVLLIPVCNKCLEDADDELRLKNEEEQP